LLPGGGASLSRTCRKTLGKRRVVLQKRRPLRISPQWRHSGACGASLQKPRQTNPDASHCSPVCEWFHPPVVHATLILPGLANVPRHVAFAASTMVTYGQPCTSAIANGQRDGMGTNPRAESARARSSVLMKSSDTTRLIPRRLRHACLALSAHSSASPPWCPASMAQPGLVHGIALNPSIILRWPGCLSCSSSVWGLPLLPLQPSR
jgi:hypothetical protein